MSEPKKETVCIVLPPRRDGQLLASNPRETATTTAAQAYANLARLNHSCGEPPAFPVPKPPGFLLSLRRPSCGLSAPAAPKPPISEWRLCP